MPVSRYAPAERALLAINPMATHARRVRKQVDELEIPTLDLCMTPDEDRLLDSLVSHAKPGDAILVGGGDGTANKVGNVLMRAQEEGVRWLGSLPMIFLRGGNANDVATMLNGYRTAAQIVGNGRRAHCHPLQISTVLPDGEESIRYAFGYSGIGAGAAAAHRLEATKFPKSPLKSTAQKASERLVQLSGVQWAREVHAVWHEGSRARLFGMTEDGRDEVLVADYMVMRGDRIAKYGNGHADLLKPQFEAIVLPEEGPLATICHMNRLLFGRLYGEMTSQQRFTVRHYAGQPLPIQYDGEREDIASGSRVTVSIADQAYQTLTTRGSHGVSNQPK